MDSPVFVEHTSLQGPVVCFLVRLCCGLGRPFSSNCVDCMLGCGVFALFVWYMRQLWKIQQYKMTPHLLHKLRWSVWFKQPQSHSLLATLIPTKHIIPLNVTGWKSAMAMSNSPLCVECDSSQCGLVGHWWMIQGAPELSSPCWCDHWSLELHAALQHSLVLGVDRSICWCRGMMF